MPEISIIVPVFKVEQYLDRCINSILGQTFKDFELILVDDGSPDNCPKMCDAWAAKDHRIRVVHKENGGLSSARNAGLSCAVGNYIGFVDSDDWIDEGMYERMHSIITEYDADMCRCECRMVSNKATWKRRIKEPDIRVWEQKDGLDWFFRIHGEKSSYGVWMGLYAREIFKDFSFVEGKTCEDVPANYYFVTHSKRVVSTNECFYNYYQNSAGLTRTFDKRRMDLLDVWDEIGEQVASSIPEYVYAYEMNKKRARFTLLSQMLLYGYDRNDEYFQQEKKELKKQVRASWWDLMRWKMPISRKVLLCIVVI